QRPAGDRPAAPRPGPGADQRPDGSVSQAPAHPPPGPGWAGAGHLAGRDHPGPDRGDGDPGPLPAPRIGRMSMRLAINGLRLGGPFTGMARYLTCLLHEWCKQPGPFTTIRVVSRGLGAIRLAARSVTPVPLPSWLPYLLCEQVLLPAVA